MKYTPARWRAVHEYAYFADTLTPFDRIEGSFFIKKYMKYTPVRWRAVHEDAIQRDIIVQHTATHCNTLQHTATRKVSRRRKPKRHYIFRWEIGLFLIEYKALLLQQKS